MLARTLLTVLMVLTVTLAGCSNGQDDPSGMPPEVLRSNNLGTSFLGQQKWADAEAAFRSGLAIRPNDAVLLNNLAIALQQQGRNDEAGEALKQAIAIAPDHPYVNYNLGLYEKNHGSHEAAITHFEKVVAYDDREVFALYNLGAALSRTDRTEEAERWLRRAVELDPTHISSVYNLGRLLLQLGQEEEGARWISKSQELREQSALNEAMGTQYGEQGPYALGCDYPGGGLLAPDPVELVFSEADTFDTSCLVATATTSESNSLEYFVCSATDLTVLAGDLNDDGTVERVALDQAGKIYQGEADASQVLLQLDKPQPVLALVDKDHDGDLDIFACESNRCLLGVNDSSGSFTWDESHALAIDPDHGEVLSLGFSDLDNDRDIDLLVHQQQSLTRFSNARDGSFIASEIPNDDTWDALFDFAIADLNKDGWMDLLLATDAGPLLYESKRGQLNATTSLAPTPALTDRVLVADLDNDGLLDAITHNNSGNYWWRNLGAGSWDQKPLVPEARVSAAYDSDGDGDLDLLTQTESTATLWISEGAAQNQWIQLNPTGVGDNQFGIGAKIEILAGDLRQKFERTNTLPLHVGLGDRTVVDSIRLLWPGGVLQDELDANAGTITTVNQLDRKGTSCPILYAWQDGEFKFITDFLGGSAIGFLHAPGVYSTPDTDELILIPGGLEETEGTLRLRMNNQLEEVIWFDQAELVVVDHPDGSQVFPNERLMPGPPWPEFKLFASADVRPIASARVFPADKSVTAELAQSDRIYAEGFDLLPFKGYATDHTLELDLGSWPAGERVVLLLEGWIDYADSSANLAAHQAGVKLQPPQLEVADGEGGWISVDHRMGFPAGLPKTMAVEVGDLFNHSDHRIRIRGNMRIYYDVAKVMVGDVDESLVVQRLSPTQATLQFGGFPRAYSPDGKKPRRYDPNIVDEEGGFKTHAGWYTAFGEVTPRLTTKDNALVTTRNGDEIILEFSAPEPPKPGFTRSYLLYTVGFGKDMEPNSAANREVHPLPYHGMPTYPYHSVPDAQGNRIDVGTGRFVPDLLW